MYRADSAYIRCKLVASSPDVALGQGGVVNAVPARIVYPSDEPDENR